MRDPDQDRWRAEVMANALVIAIMLALLLTSITLGAEPHPIAPGALSSSPVQ